MNSARSKAGTAAGTQQHVGRIGCVSYLNARPLIEGLETRDDLKVRFDVPSRLLEDLEAAQVEVALCPVIDYFTSRVALTIVPAGGIGCEGPTLTVRLFSKVEFDQLREVHTDSDSHTSTVLMRVLLKELYSVVPQLISYDAREQVVENRLVTDLEAVLLIGDKVVSSGPPHDAYPHQMDLGQTWNELTGLPFVFAVWMARKDEPLGPLPSLLAEARQRNTGNIDAIVDRYAEPHGWDKALARKYLGQYLRFNIGPRQLEAIERFGHLAAQLDVIEPPKGLRIHRP